MTFFFVFLPFFLLSPIPAMLIVVSFANILVGRYIHNMKERAICMSVWGLRKLTGLLPLPQKPKRLLVAIPYRPHHKQGGLGSIPPPNTHNSNKGKEQGRGKEDRRFLLMVLATSEKLLWSPFVLWFPGIHDNGKDVKIIRYIYNFSPPPCPLVLVPSRFFICISFSLPRPAHH